MFPGQHYRTELFFGLFLRNKQRKWGAFFGAADNSEIKGCRLTYKLELISPPLHQIYIQSDHPTWRRDDPCTSQTSDAP